VTKVGIVGLGFIGKMHLGTLRRSGLATVVAVADRVPANLTGDGAAGNINIEGDTGLDGVTLYDSGESLIRDADVDAVILALPTYLHKEFALMAIERGLHVLCEKPLALTSSEGREICDTLHGYKKAFMVGHCLRFWPAYVKAADQVRSGACGAVRHAHFARNSPKPEWSWNEWLMDERLSGGALLDLHIHDIDFANYLSGRPQHVEAVGVRQGAEGIEQVNALYRYANDVVVTLDGGWGHPASFPFRMAFRIVGTEATLVFDSALDMDLHVYPCEGEAERIPASEGDGYEYEQRYFFDCIDRGVLPTEATADSALEALELAELEQATIQHNG